MGVPKICTRDSELQINNSLFSLIFSHRSIETIGFSNKTIFKYDLFPKQIQAILFWLF